MSAILQHYSQKVVYGSSDPDHFHAGLPFDSNGALCLQVGGTVVKVHQGIPMTENGRIAVENNGLVNHFGTGSITYAASGRLLVSVAA